MLDRHSDKQVSAYGATPWEIERTALNASPEGAASTGPDKGATQGPATVAAAPINAQPQARANR
jgi:hypothetical protein